MSHRVLVVDDTEGIRYSFSKFLAEDGYQADTAAGYEEAMTMIRESGYDVVLADIILGGRTGIDLLKSIRMERHDSEVIMITGAPEVSTAADAVRYGAYDYVLKPVRKDALLKVVRQAVEHKALSDEREALRKNLEAVFRSVSEGIIVVDNHMVVTKANETAMGICAFKSDISGKHLDSIKQLCGGGCINILKENFGSRVPVEALRVNCINADGQNKKINTIVSPLVDYKGSVIGNVIVIKDESRIFTLERASSKCNSFCGIIGSSPAIMKVCSLAEDFALVDSTLLISGESGTGKGLVAQAVHSMSPRSAKPFVTVNCSALSENLLESELFGHVKGAFTGAIKDKPGRFEVAHGGTIFLDEIGEISPTVQVKLLRVLQEMEFERVGDNKTIKVDTRVIVATNRNLKELVTSGLFREDLYYRLKVLEIHAPRLREHSEDIPLLVSSFIEEFNAKFNRRIVGLDEEAKSILMTYTWPGNIRELRHVIEHAVAIAKTSIIKASDLPDDLCLIEESAGPAQGAVERDSIIDALNSTRWNKTKAAALLGVSRGTLYNKLKEFGLE